MKIDARYLIQVGIIAAIYIVFALLFLPISFGPIQIRISEALCILPFFTSAGVPGLFIGCALSNLMFSQFSIIDMAIGGGATLLAAVITYNIKNKWLAPLPAVVINAVAVGWMLSFLMNIPLIYSMLYIALGQAASCYGIGLPLLLALEKYKTKLFLTKKIKRIE